MKDGVSNLMSEPIYNPRADGWIKPDASGAKVSPSTPEATPRPWEYREGDIVHMTTPRGGKDFVALMCGAGSRTANANAALIVTAVNAYDANKAEMEAAFHRGVDAAKEAIRSEVDAEESAQDLHFFAATFINAIARKCGTDPGPGALVDALVAALKQIADKGCRITHANYPRGTTCRTVQDFARVNKSPYRYEAKFRAEILAGEHLCDRCIARAAIALVESPKENI